MPTRARSFRRSTSLARPRSRSRAFAWGSWQRRGRRMLTLLAWTWPRSWCTTRRCPCRRWIASATTWPPSTTSQSSKSIAPSARRPALLRLPKRRGVTESCSRRTRPKSAMGSTAPIVHPGSATSRCRRRWPTKTRWTTTRACACRSRAGGQPSTTRSALQLDRAAASQHTPRPHALRPATSLSRDSPASCCTATRRTPAWLARTRSGPQTLRSTWSGLQNGRLPTTLRSGIL
mmetsp:Transcript_57387/g.134770  ORF Transcript_57387/g.134770 Transcript_57387/m.134770 type:complete len:233 (-) Transcript_57387:2283-2981(-)